MSYYSFDIETSGNTKDGTALNPLKGGRIFAYVITDEKGISTVKEFNKEGIKFLNDFFANTNIEKVCHNYHFEYKYMMWYQEQGILKIPQNTKWHDTILLSQLLRNLAPSHALDDIYWEFTGERIQEDFAVAKYDDYSLVPKELMTKYQIADGERTMLLFKTFFPHIQKSQKKYQDYLNEIALIPVTVAMENYGIAVSIEDCNILLIWLEKELEDLREQTRTLLGEYCNLGSQPQVTNILFKKFGFPVLQYTKKLKESTGKDMLLMLREKYYSEEMKADVHYKNPILEMIIKHRSYTSGVTTIKKYIKLSGSDNIIHPIINTNRAQTGRESCSAPNLQNVAKEENLKNIFPIPARKCFYCRPKHILYFVDYAGIELRLIIDAAKDETMLDILAKDRDVHHEAMECFYNQKIDPKTFPEYKVRRNATKNGHFALSYGAAPQKVAATIGISFQKFYPGYQIYKERHPKIVGLIREITAIVKKQGYIETPFGRTLFVPIEEAYIGLNYLIQGTAAGLLKRAQVRVYNYLQNHKLFKDKIHLVLPIHDELVFEMERTVLQYEVLFISEVSKIMTDFKEVSVKLDVGWKRSTTNWNDAEEI